MIIDCMVTSKPGGLFFSTVDVCCFWNARQKVAFRSVQYRIMNYPTFLADFRPFCRKNTDPPASPGAKVTASVVLSSPHQGPDGQLLRHLPLASSQSNQHEATVSALVNRHDAGCLGGTHTGAKQGRRKCVLSAVTPRVLRQSDGPQSGQGCWP